MTPFAIEVSGLSKTYRKRGRPPVHAVRPLDLLVPRGQIFGFLGPNGAGKTTTIKMLCGLITPDGGRVRLEGYDVQRQRGAAMRQIGAVLEGTRNVHWRLSAWQNLEYFGGIKGAAGAPFRALAEALLHDLGLWERRHDQLQGFSRGMQQQVAIACALIADPPIVLLDEPTLGLDVHSARTVERWLVRLARDRGKTIVLTTHQLDMAETVCDRVAIMRGGALIADEPIRDLLALFRQERYRIRVAGPLDRARLDALRPSWADDLGLDEVRFGAEEGEGVLLATVPDQDALYALLDLLRALDLALVSVARVQPTLEEVFVRLTSEGGAALPERRPAALAEAAP
jgi:ABC-2 type transport system ATP-binding protein